MHLNKILSFSLFFTTRSYLRSKYSLFTTLIFNLLLLYPQKPPLMQQIKVFFCTNIDKFYKHCART